MPRSSSPVDFPVCLRPPCSGPNGWLRRLRNTRAALTGTVTADRPEASSATHAPGGVAAGMGMRVRCELDDVRIPVAVIPVAVRPVAVRRVVVRPVGRRTVGGGRRSGGERVPGDVDEGAHHL